MKTFTVIGLGRFGTSVATQLFNMGYEVLAIDKNMDKINAIANLVTRAACTDAKDESLLKQLGVKNSDCAIVCIGGLVYATFMTMFVVPVMYDFLSRKKMRIVKKADL